MWELPGPRAWRRSLDTDIGERNCVIVVCPSGDRPRGLVEQVRLLAEDGRRLYVRTPDPEIAPDFVAGRPDADGVVILVADALDVRRAPGAPFRASDLLGRPETEDLLILIDARDRDDKVQRSWMSFAEVMARAGKEKTLHDRLPVLVLVHGSSGPRVPPHDVNLAVRWWWGVIGPLDVASALDVHRDRLGRVRTAEIVELARWDLELADLLAWSWSGCPADAVDMARDLVGPVVATEDAAEPARPLGRAADTTPTKCLETWAAGLTESWDGHLDRHLAADADATSRLWIGQVGALFPRLELLRISLVERIADAASGARPAVEVPDEIVEMELGPLRSWQSKQFPGLDRNIRDVLIRARDARNQLAHRVPVEPDALAALRSAAWAIGLDLRL